MIRESRADDPNIIDLDGENGNPVALMGILRSSFRMSGIGHLADDVIKDMMSKPYPHSIKVFERYCGGTFTLITEDKELLEQLKAEN